MCARVCLLLHSMRHKNIALGLRHREIGGTNLNRSLMEGYIECVLLQYPDTVMYTGGPSYRECIHNFRKYVPANSAAYACIQEHFNWLKFEMGALFQPCHLCDFVGRMGILAEREANALALQNKLS